MVSLSKVFKKVKNMNQKLLVENFEKYHNLKIPESLKSDEIGIYWLMCAKEQIDQEISHKANDSFSKAEPTWPITLTMLDRVEELVQGCFSTFFTGVWASTEVVVRSAIEASINVIYIVERDRNIRVSQYLSYYFDNATDAINRFEKVGVSLGNTEAQNYKTTANETRNSLKSRKTNIDEILALEGIPVGESGWPKLVFDRFKRVNMEDTYRGIYANLSSQVHNDADSLIDHIIMKTSVLRLKNIGVEDAEKVASGEVLLCMRGYIFNALLFYTKAALQYAIAYNLRCVNEVKSISSRVSSYVNSLDNELP